MGELGEMLKGAAKPKGEAASAESVAAKLAEDEAEAELAAAIKSGDAKRIRAAMRAVRELDD